MIACQYLLIAANVEFSCRREFFLYKQKIHERFSEKGRGEREKRIDIFSYLKILELKNSWPVRLSRSSSRDWSIKHIVEVKEEEEKGEDDDEEEAEEARDGRCGRATAKSSGVAIAAFFHALPVRLLCRRFNLRPPLQMSRIRIPFRAASQRD